MAHSSEGSPNASIKHWFVVRDVPPGDSPIEIREQWVGLPLPLRYERNMDAPEPARVRGIEDRTADYFLPDSVTIETADAIEMLRSAQRATAAAYWEGQLARGTNHLVFNAREGILVNPDRINDIYPAIDETMR